MRRGRIEEAIGGALGSAHLSEEVRDYWRIASLLRTFEMPTIRDTINALPTILKALQESPMACNVVVTLAAFAFGAFAIYVNK